MELINRDQANKQLLLPGNNDETIASRIFELVTSIRNDFVLTKRDATVESSLYVSLLTEAKKLINNTISFETMINNVVTEMSSGQPTEAISNILTNEFSHLDFRKGKAFNLDKSPFSKAKLLESISHTQPMSLKWENKLG